MQILLDQNGYEEFYKELDELKSKLLSNAKDGSESYQSAVGDGWHDNFAFEESMRNENKIAKQINDMLKDINNIKIIEEIKEDENIVKINDIVKLEFTYTNGNTDIESIKLTGKYKPNIEETIMEVTLNSPLGQAIYHKKLLDNTNYVVKDKIINIKILKIN